MNRIIGIIFLAVLLRAEAETRVEGFTGERSYSAEEVEAQLRGEAPEAQRGLTPRLERSDQSVKYKVNNVGIAAYYTVQSASEVEGCGDTPALVVLDKLVYCYWGFTVTKSSLRPKITVHFFKPGKNSSQMNYVLYMYSPPESKDEKHAEDHATTIQPLTPQELETANTAKTVAVPNLQWLKEAIEKRGKYMETIKPRKKAPIYSYLGPPIIMETELLNKWIDVNTSSDPK